MSTVSPEGCDGGSKWREGTRETEVRLDGWCEGSLGQQRKNGGGCASIRERSGRVESPEHMYLNEFHASIFACPVFFRTALPCSGGYHLERGGTTLHDGFGINCKKGATTENQGADVKYIC